MIGTDSTSFLYLTLTIICAFGLFFISSLVHVTYRQRTIIANKLNSTPPTFWKIHTSLCKEQEIESFLFHITCAQYILGIFFVLFYFLSTYLSNENHPFESTKFIAFSFVLLTSFIGLIDTFPRILAYLVPSFLHKFVYYPALSFLLLLSPLLLILFKFTSWISARTSILSFQEPEKHLLELVRDIKPENSWNDGDKRALQSVLNFRTRIVREIMRPRVELFCIPDDLTIQQAAEMIQREGYSRVPVYKETIDEIVGILFYKDVLAKYIATNCSETDRAQFLTTPIRSIMKKVFYCPETKKIASLLQEFRKRQTHIAVIVDEYGGTAGLVTIEDILEEIVGEIADEYDVEEVLFKPALDGGWIIDARMSLIDIEEEIGIHIPQEEDYDTLAGYIFYRVGSIPQAGLVLHQDRFQLEILKSNDRMVEEIHVKPLSSPSEG